MTEKKVFVVGFNKSATTSLHTLFQRFGLKSYHSGEWRDCEDMELLNRFDCFSSGYVKNHDTLDKLFPGSKFILQLRDLKSWVYSRLAHIQRQKEQGVYQDCAIWDDTKYAIKFWILQRNYYHISILSYFKIRPDDLLVINVIRDKDIAQKVADFLNIKGRHQTPCSNVNPSKLIPPRDKVLLKQCLQELGVPEYETEYDIYCPSLSVSVFPEDSNRLITNVKVKSLNILEEF